MIVRPNCGTIVGMNVSLTRVVVSVIVMGAAAWAGRADEAKAAAVVKSEFVADEMPTASCHASTIVQSGEAMVAAWFGGKREGDPSVGIWLARDAGHGWGKPVEVANGETPERRYPCWNPVLFQPKEGPLILFYKMGPSPSTWWGMMMTSADGGVTWSKSTRLPDGILGPIKNKPVELADGRLLCGSSTEGPAGWRLEMEWTNDLGRTWGKTPPLNDGKTFGAIQPSILKLADGGLALVCRSKQGKVLFARSLDKTGEKWGELAALAAPNPNSGIDALTLADGRHLMVYNDTPRGRTPLNVALSADGMAWRNVLTLESEAGEYSYPAVIQARDGRVHVTYTWKRERVRHVVIDAAGLQ